MQKSVLAMTFFLLTNSGRKLFIIAVYFHPLTQLNTQHQEYILFKSCKHPHASQVSFITEARMLSVLI